MFYKIIFLTLFVVSAFGSNKREVSSLDSIVSIEDIKVFVENRTDEIFKEPSINKRKNKFRDLYLVIKDQVSSYNKAIESFYNEEGFLASGDVEVSEGFLKKKKQEIVQKQKLLDRWASLFVDFKGPAGLLLPKEDSEHEDCDTVESKIKSEYLIMAPEGTDLSEDIKRSIKVARALCGQKL